MRWGYIGNFGPEHSTENHVLRALRSNGARVYRYQENDPDAWAEAALAVTSRQVDVMLWTHTEWTPGVGHETQMALGDTCRAAGIPLVGYHLDRWWGLAGAGREQRVHDEAFFKAPDLLCTADGGHEAEWRAIGVNHAWFPPAVLRAEAARPGVVRHGYQLDVVFVGSWQSYGHPEWQYRVRLVEWLGRRYGSRLGLFPQPGRHALRGQPLNDLYTSCKVVVGDSCLAGDATHYWSDRVPETIGRGGFLIHPRVVGMDRDYTPGIDFIAYRLGDFEELGSLIDHYVRDTETREAIAHAGRARVLTEHTYEARMARLSALLQQHPWSGVGR